MGLILASVAVAVVVISALGVAAALGLFASQSSRTSSPSTPPSTPPTTPPKTPVCQPWQGVEASFVLDMNPNSSTESLCGIGGSGSTGLNVTCWNCVVSGGTFYIDWGGQSWDWSTTTSNTHTFLGVGPFSLTLKLAETNGNPNDVASGTLLEQTF